MTGPQYAKYMATYDFDGDNHASIIQLSADYPDESDVVRLVAQFHETTPDRITNLGSMEL